MNNHHLYQAISHPNTHSNIIASANRCYQVSGWLCVLLTICSLAITVYPKAQAPVNPEMNVIPYPQQVTGAGGDFVLSNNLTITLDKNHSATDAFTAKELILDLKTEWNIDATISSEKK